HRDDDPGHAATRSCDTSRRLGTDHRAGGAPALHGRHAAAHDRALGGSSGHRAVRGTPPRRAARPGSLPGRVLGSALRQRRMIVPVTIPVWAAKPLPSASTYSGHCVPSNWSWPAAPANRPVPPVTLSVPDLNCVPVLGSEQTVSELSSLQ